MFYHSFISKKSEYSDNEVFVTIEPGWMNLDRSFSGLIIDHNGRNCCRTCPSDDQPIMESHGMKGTSRLSHSKKARWFYSGASAQLSNTYHESHWGVAPSGTTTAAYSRHLPNDPLRCLLFSWTSLTCDFFQRCLCLVSIRFGMRSNHRWLRGPASGGKSVSFWSSR